MALSIRTSLKAACLTLLLAGGSAMAQTPSNEINVAAPQVQQYLDSAFPQQYEALGGLFTLTARDPKLTIPATGERLLMAFSASAASAGGSDTPVGRIEMSSGLRYDPQRYALYLDQPTLDNMRPATPGQRIDEQTRVLLNLWLADYARKEPLYKLDPALLANFGDVKVESARIENGHIVVRFNQPVGMPDLSDAQD
ncbi:MAG: DUF1439 domain-containing protein [Pseudoxanthomonas sp.]